MPRFRLLLAAVVAAVLLVPASPAAAKIQIGISEQNPNVFLDRYYKPLGVKYARIVVPWDILKRTDYWPGYLQAWLNGAKATNTEPHVAFNVRDLAPKNLGKGPTLGQYRTLIRGFRKKYPQVRVFTPWNEANHSFQPTAKKPKLAAQYYKILRQNCKGCKVLAADVLDDHNMESWLKQFKRYYNGRATWGIHNYQDANKNRSFRASQTFRIAKLVKGDIWSTEAGGLVGFKTVKGRVAYKYSIARQTRATKHLFRLMGDRRVRNRYKRVYIYHYFGTWSKTRKTNRWDSGLLGLDGKRRPAYFTIQRLARQNNR
jgi:hypothetical protein